MAQEQAKSGSAAAGAKEQKPLDAMTRSRDEKSGEGLERGPELPKRTSLAERLKAEQRKREGIVEPKRDEPPKATKAPEETSAPKPPLEFAEAPGPSAAPTPPRQFVRTKRPAGPPPQRRLATPANDDVPSIGGLIFALQQRPSRTPFLIALAASAVWFIVGGFFAFGLISTQVASNGMSGLLGSASALTAAVAILVPIVIFWFLALLVWRAQELRLMASAMTEVAVRLAEPDRLAEQSVASVGQTIRRQVAAMNDAISRAIGRASELEAMVHSEVAALERSYGENEIRVRGLISELATEREALANNSARVSEALKGVGQQVARDIATASSSIDKKLSERGIQLTELLVARSSEAAEQVHKAQNRVAEAVPGLLERLSKEQGRLSQVIEGATQNLAALESVVVQRTTVLDKTMKERTEALQSTLATRIKGLETTVAQGAILLDKTLKDRTDAFTASIGQSADALNTTLKERTEGFTSLLSQGAVLMDNTLKQRTETLTASIGQSADALNTTLKERTEGFTSLLSQGAVLMDNTLKQRTETLTATIGEGAVLFDNTLKQRTEALAATIGQGAQALDNTLKQRTEVFAATVGQGAGILDKTMKDRTEAFTNLVSQGAVVLDKTLQERTNALATAIGQGADALNKTLADRTGQFNAVIDQKAALLDRALVERAAGFAVAVDQRASAMDKSLQDRTAQFIAAINQGAIVLDKTLAERAESFTNSLFQRVKSLETAISQQTGSLDKTMTERAQAVIIALAERLKAIDMTFNQRAVETDRMLGEHARATAETFGKQTAQLNQVLANNSAIMQQTANQVGTQSKEAVSILTSQTQTLREVSRGLLDQIHGLTQRFENQGQAILTAAKALEFVEHQDQLNPGRPPSSDHRAAAHGQHQGAGPRQHHALLCRHGRKRDGQCGSPREASRHGAGARHCGSGASRAATDRAPARRGASPYPARGRRPQVELRDGHHPDRPATRADARPVRQHLSRHARDGAEDGERSRQPASGNAEADGRPARAYRSGDRGHPQGIVGATPRDRGDHRARSGAAGGSAAGPGPRPVPAGCWSAAPAILPGHAGSVQCRSAAAFRCEGTAGRLAGRRYRSGRGRARQSAEQRRSYAAAAICWREPRHARGASGTTSGARGRTASSRRDCPRH